MIISLLIVVCIFAVCCVVLGLAVCKAASPNTKEEQYRSDQEQLQYIRKYRQENGMV